MANCGVYRSPGSGRGRRAVGFIRRSRPRPSPPRLSAHGRWETGSLQSSEQCEGRVEARESALFARDGSGKGSAAIPWEHVEGFGVDNAVLVISVGAPWFWLFDLDLDDDQCLAEWTAFLEAKNIPLATV
jgi:hypothetical protein